MGHMITIIPKDDRGWTWTCVCDEEGRTYNTRREAEEGGEVHKAVTPPPGSRISRTVQCKGVPGPGGSGLRRLDST